MSTTTATTTGPATLTAAVDAAYAALAVISEARDFDPAMGGINRHAIGSLLLELRGGVAGLDRMLTGREAGEVAPGRVDLAGALAGISAALLADPGTGGISHHAARSALLTLLGGAADLGSMLTGAEA